MKAIILSVLATVLSLLLATVTLRRFHIDRRALAFLVIFLVVLGLLVPLSLLTPDDLTIIPRDLVATPTWFDLMSTIFFFTAAFFGGVLQIYNLADRGFSLRILIDLQEQPDDRRGLMDVYHGYSSGKGIRWMYRKRLDDMLRNRLIVIRGEELIATRAGVRMASIFALLRCAFKFERE